ncbi:MAG: hypothetical protein DPW18_02680 [Chloroflexi bacterium]|nr:hypothetical protein [Chloroflexota bacterium]MDL1942928.1 hypothetical protein [Chloroflexi bacterium CFX2]
MNFTLKRILVSFVLGLALGALTTELAYFFLKRENREPAVVEILIPPGTAEKIRRGEGEQLDLPDTMQFVVGDTIKVINEDSENHNLGPLWIPAGSSASLKLDSEENLAYECSFQADNYFGLTVREPVTWRTRLFGIFLAGFPLSMIFVIYSGLIPGGRKKETA